MMDLGGPGTGTRSCFPALCFAWVAGAGGRSARLDSTRLDRRRRRDEAVTGAELPDLTWGWRHGMAWHAITWQGILVK